MRKVRKALCITLFRNIWLTAPAGKQYWRNIGPISTYWVNIGQYYNIGPMLVRYCGANVTVWLKFHLARLDSTRHVRLCRASRARRVERVELCCSTSSSQPKCMGSTRRMCRVESSRAKWNLSLSQYWPILARY